MHQARRALAIAAFTLVSCSSQVVPASTPTSDAVMLRFYTTGAALPLMSELSRAYTQIKPAVSFDISASNYGGVLRLMEADDSYFLTTHLPPVEESPFWAAPVAQDGIAIVVHPSNIIEDLTTEQLRRIFQGRITNWSELAGEDAAITVISREDGSGTRAEFERLVMGDRRPTQLAQIAPSHEAVLVSVGRETGSIGYVSMSYLDSTVHAIMIDGAALTPNSVFDNTYPLRSTLFVAGMQEPQDENRAFIAWVQSPEGQAVVARRYAPLYQP